MLRTLAACLASWFAGAAAAQAALPDTWGATDGLGRALPEASAVGPHRPDRAVLMFYFVWHGAHGYDEHRQPPPDGGVWPKTAASYASPYDLSRILAAARPGAAPAYGPVHAFHHWGEPRLGYYLSDDTAVLRRHALWLVDAGVDAVAIDVTNGLTYAAIVARLLDVWAELRALGTPTPAVTFLAHSGARDVVQALWREVYAPRRHPGLWFRWRGKPLLLAPAEALDAEQQAFFTVRRSWAWSAAPWFGDGRDAWPWLDHHPQRPGWHEAPDRPEAIAVAAAQHPTSNIGRSFHAGRQPPPAAQRPELGLCFAEQWQRALEVDPELVFVTGWNEWSAMRFLADGSQSLAGRALAAGESYFVDQYSLEYSRDLEPMRGGSGDAAYWQLVGNVRRFKGARQLPPATAPAGLSLAAPAAAWAAVQPAYRDHAHDDFGRDHPGYGGAGPYRQPPARNDLVLAKVAPAGDSLLFLLRARQPLRWPAADAPDVLRLLLDVDLDGRNGWAGFEFAIGGRAAEPGTLQIARLGGSWRSRRPAGVARYRAVGTDLVVEVPRSLVGLPAQGARFAFRWVDGVGDADDPADHALAGDSAPDWRFTFRYREP